MATTQTPTDGRRARGDRSRHAVLEHSVQVASTRGLDGLTFGALAVDVPVNKSGIAGLFGSKEGLQLATVAHARQVFLESVVLPARTAAAGLDRLWALTLGWSAYSRGRTFAGGCFFRAVEAEVDSRHGPVRDAVVATQREWDGYLARHVAVAVDVGDLAADTDPDQVVFEIVALLGAANDRSLLLDDAAAYDRALAAVRAVLGAHGADVERLA
jgi:AcrR family transcriptional regulator